MTVYQPLIPKRCAGCESPIPSNVRRAAKKALIKRYGRVGARREAAAGKNRMWCNACDPETDDTGRCSRCDEGREEVYRDGEVVAHVCGSPGGEQPPEDSKLPREES